jgi:hypothetical protein
MVTLLAKNAPVGVILRRGPTRWWHVTLWNTKRDEFESGQWFHGRIYPEKCDVSPDGQLFGYFAAKHGRWHGTYQDTWTAVSRPPYLTALALWPIGGTYGGDAVFLDDKTIMVGWAGEPQHHRDHPPGPLRVVGWRSGGLSTQRSCEYGWQGSIDVRKTSGQLELGREWPVGSYYPSNSMTPYRLPGREEQLIATFEAHWADWDQQGRLVATVGGRVIAGKLTRDKRLVWRQLADLHDEKPTRLEAPDWAQGWKPLPRRRRRNESIPHSPHRQ